MTSPKRILVVDDNAEDREAVIRYLEQDRTCNYEFLQEGTVAEGVKTAFQKDPHCIVLDYSLNDGTGIDFLQEMRRLNVDNIVAIVMLTGSGDEMIAVQAMKIGAADYLIKDKTSAESLRLAVRSAMYKAGLERLLRRQREELERLYREAQAASEAKDRFLATLSHELRTPLTPVLSTVSSMLAEKDGLTAEVRAAFEMIRRNVGLEARLIDDLLDLTRITRGKLTLELKPLDLHACIRDAIEICRPDYAAKEIELKGALCAASDIVLADSARLHQVFWNLLKNAVKFTPARGEVSIGTSNEGSEIVIRVEDNGVGIAPVNLPNVFNAFEQGDTELANRSGGLGLGLAISKALVEAHHGKLQAESAGLNRGSAFTIRLPLAGPAAALRQTDLPPRESYGMPHPCRILLVEDHGDSAIALTRALTRRSFQVKTAGSLAKAEELFQQEEFDLLICDIGLPDGSGLELLERLRRPGLALPAIALSGFGMEHDLRRSREAGFSAHLTKPVDFQKLVSVIGETLGMEKV